MDGLDPLQAAYLEKVSVEMSLHVLVYNLKRMIAILGVQPLTQPMRAA